MEKENDFARFIYEAKKNIPALIPNRRQVDAFTDNLMELLFSQNCTKNEFILGSCIQNIKKQLNELIARCYNGSEIIAGKFTDDFLDKLIPIYGLLLKDAASIEASDPAVNSVAEVINSYPGFYAISVHRLAHELYLLNIPFLPRLMSEYAHSRTGIDIHPGATIGNPFAIDHGTGIVIGQTAIIGSNVKIYQGVTLGALSVKKSNASIKRHPTIEDHVILYAGCTILGGGTVVGHHSVIGGNVWLTSSVEPYSIVYNTNEIKIQSKPLDDEPVNFII
jgi:serine O-acetyltransferase